MTIMELADAYAEAKVELGIGVSGFGKDSKLTRHRDTRAALEAAVDELEKVAARYRWLRNRLYFGDVDVGEAYITMRVVGNFPNEQTFDAAIDAAMGETK